ncbi:MAG: iron chaperone [Anaerolineales bacterium]
MSDEKRGALERLRNAIRAAAPRAEECISYQLPAFRLDGRMLVGYGAAANHCAIYGAVDAAFEDGLKDYDTSKGTIRFQADHPLPASLVRKLVKARIAKNAAQQRRTD